MKTYPYIWGLLLSIVVFAAFGCRRNIVRASPPSVAPEPIAEVAPPPPPTPPPVIIEQPQPLPATQPEPEPASPVAPPAPRPKPAPAEPAKAKPEPEPVPPQISPQLTPRQQQDAMRQTTDDVRTAEKNLQAANGKQLNASQKDLSGKISEFLAQAHEAIRANDWVRAAELARKASILSNELLKGL